MSKFVKAVLVIIALMSLYNFVTQPELVADIRSNVSDIVDSAGEKLSKVLGYVWSHSANVDGNLVERAGEESPEVLSPTPSPTTPSSAAIEKIKNSMVLVSCDIKAINFNGHITEFIDLKASGSGVVIKREPGKVYVVTSRHVIDCVYTGDCWGVIEEKITLMSLKGTKVSSSI